MREMCGICENFRYCNRGAMDTVKGCPDFYTTADDTPDRPEYEGEAEDE